MSLKERCCVPECTRRTVIGHVIPPDPVVREIWLQRIGDATLLNKPEKALRCLRVCDTHFERTCVFAGSGKLRPRALPTLYLPGYVRVPGDTFANQEEPKRGYQTPEKIAQGINLITGSGTTALGGSQEMRVLRPTRVYGKRMLPKGASEVKEEPREKVSRRSESPQPGPSGLGTTLQAEEVEAPTTPVIVSNTSATITQEKVEEAPATPVAVAKTFGSSLRQMKHRKRPKKPKYDYIIPRELYELKRKALNPPEGESFRRQLKNLTEMPIYDKLELVNETTLKFFISRMCERHKPKVRQFTPENKVFALSAYRQSPKGYRFVSKFFSLPPRKMLVNFLGKMPLNCGIDPKVFQHLKGAVRKLKKFERYCVLMFGEMALSPGLHYNEAMDRVDGVVDYGNGDRRRLYAERALVFMLRGIQKRWKQPICFYFCESLTPTAHLVGTIKEVIRHVRQIGLVVVATVCDQGPTNCAAIDYLLNETERYHTTNNIENRLQGYLVDGKEVVHFFDPPHLLMGIRNALISRDLFFRQDGVERVGRWRHIVETFYSESDSRYRYLRLVTEGHVVPSKIKKTRVRSCTQVFSHRMGALINFRARSGENFLASSPNQPLPTWCLDPSAYGTAYLVAFFNQLFDSVNGHLLTVDSPVDELKGVVTINSPHVDFWRSAIPVLESMRFLPSQDRPGGTTRSLKKFIFTVRSFLYIWYMLKDRRFRDERGIISIRPRCFNLDPLENLFAVIRRHGVKSSNPTCASFILSYKSLILNNFKAPRCTIADREKDNSKGALDTLRELLMDTSKFESEDTCSSSEEDDYFLL